MSCMFQWSFGVAMWEIMTHGDVPYESLKAEGLLMTLQDGQRLEQPSSCPNQMYVILDQPFVVFLVTVTCFY